MDITTIKPGFRVYTRARGDISLSPGEHVGTVENVEAEGFVKLRRSDSPDGHNHWFPLSWVEKIENRMVYLRRTLEEFERDLIDSDPSCSARAS